MSKGNMLAIKIIKSIVANICHDKRSVDETRIMSSIFLLKSFKYLDFVDFLLELILDESGVLSLLL